MNTNASRNIIMTAVQKTVAENIRYYRHQKGMTQEQLAEKVDTATNFIGCIEIGNKFPSFKMIERIANALEIDQFALFRKDVMESFSEADLKDLENTLVHNITNAVKATFEKRFCEQTE